VFAKGTEDPHFVEAKPSFVKELSTADLLIVAGSTSRSAGCRR
jgi:ABC-type Zn uptake system ZnuABC Zn-binding protein ZnuA